jgi:hypothetical protein
VKVTETFTVTEALTAEYTGFEQDTENTVVEVSVGDNRFPDVASEPDRASAPVHAFAFWDDHVSVTWLFVRMRVASAEMLGVGAFQAVTVAVPEPDPPPPVHVIM